MKLFSIAAAAGALTSPAFASAATVKPLIDTRLRWEDVDQKDVAKDADAVTFRARLGLEIATGDWRLLGEVESTTALDEHYFSGLNGKTQYPLVADPTNLELNRFQVQYRGLPKTFVTVGRQRINIEDQRFVGSVGWRQNEQTFDAARVEYETPKGLQLDLTYSWRVQTIWGVDGTGVRPRGIDGNNIFAMASYPTPIGKLSGFAFLVDQDNPAVQTFKQSSQSYGARLSGAVPLSKLVKLNYALSYAGQSNYHRNPNRYSATYYLFDAGLDVAAFRLGAGYEVLGGDGGAPFTSFQTPLATLHKFQGWADKFLVTPPNGIRDFYASAGYGLKKPIGLDSITTQLVYHRFDSDRLSQHYGNEWDALIAGKKGRWTATAKLASYSADKFATNTRKLWLQLEWAY